MLPLLRSADSSTIATKGVAAMSSRAPINREKIERTAEVSFQTGLQADHEQVRSPGDEHGFLLAEPEHDFFRRETLP